ncbi:MAG: hypothetical protein ABI091_06475 [Ferruginibacter sp.]
MKRSTSKKAMSFIFLCSGCFLLAANLSAQPKKTFDIVSYTVPKGWKKQEQKNIISYSISDKKNNSWCVISIVKSTISKGTIEADFESEWQELVAKPYSIAELPQTNEVQEKDGWKLKDGGGKFVFNGTDAIAMLTTFSEANRCVSIVTTTNVQDYLPAIEAMIGSVELKKTAGQVQPVTQSASQVATGFKYSTTNFTDGWTSVIQADWIEVRKNNIKVLIHYPNKTADAYNSVLMDGLKNAWDILVAPRYSSARNFSFKPLQSWQSIEFAEADCIEKISGNTVHVVLFKKDFSNGNGKYLEFITPDKNTLEQEFGPYVSDATEKNWDKMAAMASYNKFAVDAGDLSGKWTTDFSGITQFVNAYTGANAGMSTHSSAQSYDFTGNTYKWQIAVASGFVGNIKFQNMETTGKFSLPDMWHIYFSDKEGKPKTYNAFFSCIKGARVLWLDDTGYAKSE